MPKQHKNRLTLYCFSPLVMLITFSIEFLLAAYVWFRYRATQFGRIVIMILLCLGVFQLAEYQICAGYAPSSWVRLGLIAITLLPALGLHLIAIVTGRYRTMLFSYGVATLFIGVFLFAPNMLYGGVCEGNYVVIKTNPTFGGTWGMYYFAFLILAVWQTGKDLRIAPKTNELGKAKVLIGMIAGYLSFLLPLAVVYVAEPSTRSAVPSIMCGFALTLALILSFSVLPNYAKLKPTH